MTEMTEPTEPLNAEQEWRRDREMLIRRVAHQRREAAEDAARGMKRKPDTTVT